MLDQAAHTPTTFRFTGFVAAHPKVLYVMILKKRYNPRGQKNSPSLLLLPSFADVVFCFTRRMPSSVSTRVQSSRGACNLAGRTKQNGYVNLCAVGCLHMKHSVLHMWRCSFVYQGSGSRVPPAHARPRGARHQHAQQRQHATGRGGRLGAGREGEHFSCTVTRNGLKLCTFVCGSYPLVSDSVVRAPYRLARFLSERFVFRGYCLWYCC